MDKRLFLGMLSRNTFMEDQPQPAGITAINDERFDKYGDNDMRLEDINDD